MIVRPALRRAFGLPPRRCRSWTRGEWIPMPDGTRLRALHVWPIGAQGRVPCILARTPYDANTSLAPWLPWSRLLAESGYHVLVQDVRGRYASEGRFEPFRREAADGAHTLEWLQQQSWCEGPIGLFGWSYLAYCAWAALGESPQRVGALSVAIGSGRLHRIFRPGGAFALSAALEWATGVGQREREPPRQIDLQRGLAFRPVREADRVALRTLDFYRDWTDHPRDDDYWKALQPRPIAEPPPTLLLAGWYDFFLSAQLRDHDQLHASNRTRSAGSHRLIIGPWAHGLPARMRWWRNPLPAVLLRETLAHFDHHLKRLRPADARRAPVRFFVPGAECWQDASKWPPPGAEEQSLYLRSQGRLDPRKPTADEQSDRYRHDPERPVPTLGGPLFGFKAGVRDQRPVLHRRDVLLYRSAPLRRPQRVLGCVRVRLHVASSAPDADFVARLLDIHEDGRADNVCDGVTRCRWREPARADGTQRRLEAGEPIELEIELDACARLFTAGHRIGLAIASSSHPRFDVNHGGKSDPTLALAEEAVVAEQEVFHDAARPSRLCLELVPDRERRPGEQAPLHLS